MEILNLKRVVVTGIGAITPIGNNITLFWESLINGNNGAELITKFDTSKFKTKFACQVKDYNPELFFDKKDARKLDLFSQYSIISTDEAIKDSGLTTSNFNEDSVGVIYASGIGGGESFADEAMDYGKSDGTPRFNPFMVPKMIADIAAGHISIKHGFKGPNFGVVSACASSANAISDAYNYIRLGKADAIITGGSEAPIHQMGVGGFASMKALSQRNDDPATASRPFDLNSDGFVLGEGAAALVLEEYEHAKARGAKIYAELVGVGLTADAHHITSPHPQGIGARKCMQFALKEAKVDISEVDYINTHGTSTPVGDIAESLAIDNLFGPHTKNLSISSSKSMTGHLLGAAGAIESIASILAINNGIIPPTINHFNDDPAIADLDFTFHKAKKKEVNIAISNNFGFGGHNVSIVLKKFCQ